MKLRQERQHIHPRRRPLFAIPSPHTSWLPRNSLLRRHESPGPPDARQAGEGTREAEQSLSNSFQRVAEMQQQHLAAINTEMPCPHTSYSDLSFALLPGTCLTSDRDANGQPLAPFRRSGRSAMEAKCSEAFPSYPCLSREGVH